MDDAMDDLFSIGTMIIVLGIIALLISQNSQTANVIQSIGKFYAWLIGVVKSPLSVVSGSGTGSPLSLGIGLAGTTPVTTPLPIPGVTTPLGMGGIGSA